MIPANTGEITVDWLNEKLADHDDIGVVSAMTREPMGMGVGILCELARLHLTYAEGQSGPATMIAKCQSVFPENIGFCVGMGFYQREISFYNQLSATLNARVPQHYVAEIADDNATFVLVIEEITGAHMIDQLEGANLEEATLVLDMVAALHAQYWGASELDDMAWLPPMNNEMYKMTADAMPANRDAFAERWGPMIPDVVLDACDQLLPRGREMLDYLYGMGTSTLTHTDCRAENFLFGGSAGDGTITMLDFQMLTRHLGAYDIAYFLGQSLSIENRRAWEDQLLRRYHQRLLDLGVPASYTYDQCLTEYRYSLMHQAFSQLLLAGIDPGNDRGRELLDAFVERAFLAAADNNGMELVDQL